MANYGRPGVYITERLLPAPIASVATADAAGAVVGVFAQGPEDVTLISSWYQFTKVFGGYNNAYPATFGVGQFFQNGGGELYVKRVLASDAAASGVPIPSSNIVADLGSVIAKNRGVDGNNLRIQITPVPSQANYYDLVVYKETVQGTGANVANDIVLEKFTNVVVNNRNSSDFIETVVNLQSEYLQIFVSETTGVPSSSVLPLIGGTDGTTAVDTDYSGAIESLSAIDRPLVLSLPGVISEIGAVDATGVYNSAIDWAENNNGFVIAETDSDLSVADAITYATSLTDSSHAAVYYPHFYVSDPLGRSPQSLRKTGPSAAVAGLFIATDKSYGPFKAPAGIRASISGALALEKGFTSTELDTLNSGANPVNALRNLPGSGVVSMGARTLKQDGTANKYVNMRRSLIYITKRLRELTEFALFESNDEVLWARINSTINVFLGEYRNIGGLRGATADEAYFIKVDAENNPLSTIQQGEVHIEVGVALQYPAEFVVINLSQKTAA